MSTRLRKFRALVLAHYKKHGRHSLPWRKTKDPYKILVSEVMLQQTQVDRVVPYYKRFVRTYPTARALAAAPLRDVLGLWQGLGYNRRAKYLHEAARLWGKVPLEELPGVGPYTAGAVRAFAYNEPVLIIETNIRAALLHHFFPNAKAVPDSKLLPYMEVPRGKAREWYAALMDYGSYLKATHPNPSRRSKHHTTQSKFKGSNRELRGAILKAHLTGTRVTGFPKARVQALRKKLKREGLI